MSRIGLDSLDGIETGRYDTDLTAGRKGLRSAIATGYSSLPGIAIVGVGIIVVIGLFCFLGPVLYHTDQVNSQVLQINESPSGSHLLGTDDNGFDVLGRLMVGGQSALEIGFAAALLATGLGVVWGTVAGLLGGIVDAILMRLVDSLLALPALFLLLFLAAVLAPRTSTMIIVIAIVAWLVPAPLAGAETLTLRARAYVDAVRCLLGGSSRIGILATIPTAARS